MAEIGTIRRMRTVGLILLLTTAAWSAPKDLRLRYGSGWTGFKKGSSVTMKVTTLIPNRMIPSEVQKTTLIEVGKKELKLERATRNQLTGERKTTWKTPTTGEAGPGETQSIKKLEDEKIRVAGREWACSRREVTVKGKGAKRVITQWTAKNPLLRIKRLVKTYDAFGKLVSTQSIMLLKSPALQKVAGKELVCVSYRSLTKTGKVEERQDTVHSRQIPGDLVSLDWKRYDKGKLQITLQQRVLRFEIK